MSLLERALAEPPAPEKRAALLLILGRTETALGRVAALEHLNQAYELSVDPIERARCARELGLAPVILHTGHRDFERIIRAIEEVDRLDPELALELEAAYAALRSIDGTPAYVTIERLERFAGLDGSTPAECSLLGLLAHVRMDLGQSSEAAASLVERAVRNHRVVAEVGFGHEGEDGAVVPPDRRRQDGKLAESFLVAKAEIEGGESSERGTAQAGIGWP